MGVWIETGEADAESEDGTSHPAWVCGLKLAILVRLLSPKVTPCVGVWIETNAVSIQLHESKVTPCVGVWIETLDDLAK